MSSEVNTLEIADFFRKIYASDLGDMKVLTSNDRWNVIKRILITKCPAIESEIRVIDGYPSLDWTKYPIDAVRCFLSYLYTGKMYSFVDITVDTANSIHQLFIKYKIPVKIALTMDMVNDHPYEMMILLFNHERNEFFAKAVEIIRQRICKCYAGNYHLFPTCMGGLCQPEISADERKKWLETEMKKFHAVLTVEMKSYILSEIITRDERVEKEMKKKVKEEKKKEEVNKSESSVIPAKTSVQVHLNPELTGTIFLDPAERTKLLQTEQVKAPVIEEDDSVIVENVIQG
jgi:hypothetical protein